MMKYYRSSDDVVYGYEEGEQDELIFLAVGNGWEDITGSWPPPPPPPSTDELKSAYVNAVQEALDTKAKERGYDGILSLCTYAASSIPVFLSEGQAGVVWRDTSWLTCYQMLESWQAGTIAQPSIAEVLAALPVMMWPDEEE